MRSTAVLAWCCLLSTVVPAAGPEGTLRFEVRNYESLVKMKKYVVRQLEHGGLLWGLVDDELVVSMVSPKFINADLSQLTRWGEFDELRLPPGEYRITCVGYEQRELSRNPDKVLSESAYFNPGILTFTITSGGTTRVEVLPRFRKSGTFLKLFIPDLRVSVYEGDEKTAEAMLCERTERSIDWDDYRGPLKF